MNFGYSFPRYKEALKHDDYTDVSHELAQECFDMFHKAMNSIDGANSWYETSCDDHEYEECEGDQTLHWKDKGYVTVFDLLQVRVGTVTNYCLLKNDKNFNKKFM